ncbi:NADP-dependent aldehyde dehydrogenase [Nakamurella panacisegetis]|uniref:NADP-dependent aldehyde dehydrogenase n=1 Tax=Nakamurella panacisegetis TaxID=1090615 RepID=A0A1H0S6H8_9ACTN|nr:aldehyde dehydrogenase (NADP(+)) [Nakamurella panacisegetis]SDP37373.1 NADP-dependent aldehyde dehydrogenase [Nakamurella panacisegetis]
MTVTGSAPSDTAGSTSAPDVDRAIAAAAASAWARTSASDRIHALNAVADALTANTDELVEIAVTETHLGDARLRGEIQRTAFQLRLFGAVLAEGSYLDARIDHADPGWPMGAPRPDLRRMLQPLGPVLVFAASNFPFAFSVAGGDTASALAAGCPVIVKAHPGHPALSVRTAEVVVGALADVGAPVDAFALIIGDEAGRQALTDPRVKAAAFTGSIRGGRTLFDLANGRREPIPFYGELGSVNPVFVTQSAAAIRPADIAAGLVTSFTLGAGQFCTKPGVVFLPGHGALLDALGHADLPPAATLLNPRIESHYREVLEQLSTHEQVEILTSGAVDTAPAPTVLRTTVDALLSDPETLLTECFGPTVLLVTYRTDADMLAAAEILDGQLTATVHGEPDDAVVPDLMAVLTTKAGRLLWNQWPTGVSVTHAQQHGGPYPATTAPTTTSVGTAAINRFLRPVAYQGFPVELLPTALDDANTLGIPRRIDGQLRLGDS